MARGEISTASFASLLARPGKPILASGSVLKPFSPNRELFACARFKRAPIAIEHEAEELLQCKRVEFATAACSRVRVKHRPPAALANSLPAQFITYQTRNSVQSNGASSIRNQSLITSYESRITRHLARYRPAKHQRVSHNKQFPEYFPSHSKYDNRLYTAQGRGQTEVSSNESG